MANKNNKVKYNLKNAHYAMLTVGEDGAVRISLAANGKPEKFYVDGFVYYVINNNMGYDGDLELEMIPESFWVSALNETLDDKKAFTIESPTLFDILLVKKMLVKLLYKT